MRVVGRLPRLSAYKKAVESDPEVARRLADSTTLSDIQQDVEPSLLTWTRDDEIDANFSDWFAQLAVAVISPHIPKDKTIPRPERARRPSSARQKILDAREYELIEQRLSVLDQFVNRPEGGDDG